MLKIYVTHGVVVDEVHETISFIQSEFSKKMIHFDTQKNEAGKDSQRHFYKLLKKYILW